MRLCSCGADVDVLRVDAITPASSGEEAGEGGGSRGCSPQQRSARRGSRGGPGSTPPARDDLRNYAYEGDGSSPGSLSSCECVAKDRLRGSFLKGRDKGLTQV